jgi:hypothetical protein
MYKTLFYQKLIISSFLMKSLISSIILFFLLSFIPTNKNFIYSQVQEYPQAYRQISLEEYRDKVEGGWLGQAIAVLWAEDTEFKWRGEMVPFDLDDWYRAKPLPQELENKANSMKNRIEMKQYLTRNFYNDKNNWVKWTPEKMSDQDDIYIEFMFLHSIHKYGLDVTGTEIAEDWVQYLDPERIWGANKSAYMNFRKGIWPPLSGNPRYNRMGDAIDFQIEADLFGLISPGMPRISNSWCDKVGHIMNYGDGVYAGMAMAAMYSEAFFESDPLKLAEYSLKAIPSESGYAAMVRDVIDLYKRQPNWQEAWKVLQKKWGERDGNLVPNLDAKINGAYVYMGLLYGGGDFLKSMNISMRCGLDSDCNPSSGAGILGTAMGMKNIPEKWAMLRKLPIDNIAIRDIYPKLISWEEILEKTIEAGKWNILQNGGHLDQGVFHIPHQSPISPPLEQTIWEEATK